ncbi:MAG: hypothetical protein J6Q39_06900 [Bacteroidales bacterium]|nr:hypothetical protein [Bacteroidales bacterium]
MEKKKNLTPKQKRAVQLLIYSDMTYTQICEELQINMKTLWRWRNEPDFAQFQREYERVKEEQWLATVEAARLSALKLCRDGNQKMTEFILKNDGLNPTQKVEANVTTDIVITIGDDDEEEIDIYEDDE